MSLPLALAYLDRLGVRECRITPDHDPQFWTVYTDRSISRGAAAILTTRMRLAVLEHRRALSEPAAVLDESWSIERTEAGGVLLRHPSCRLLSLPRYGENTTEDVA